MTDRPSPGREGRLDLRALDLDADAREERVMSAVLARIAADRVRGPGEDPAATIRRFLRPAIAAAAVLAAVAVGTVALTASAPRGGGSGAVDLLSSWAQSEHVPTNGDLLLAFQGYGAVR